MARFKYCKVSEFNLEGEFLGFLDEASGKLKYLRVAIATNELYIKLPKESRAALGILLQPGDWIQVSGEKKQNWQTGKLKLKADRVRRKAVTNRVYATEADSATVTVEVLPSLPKARILVCQKSGCLKRGGKGLCQALEAVLCDRGLQNQVTIEPTSCMKRCSKAPNLLLMPGKTRLSGMKPEAIATLLETHLTSSPSSIKVISQN